MKSLNKLSAAELEEVRQLGASVLRNQTPTVTQPRYESPPVTKLPDVPPEAVKEVKPLITRRTLGRPRVHKTNAERQRAYRERKSD